MKYQLRPEQTAIMTRLMNKTNFVRKPMNAEDGG
jgi:hypothetical protein